MINGRNKGNNYELKIAKEINEELMKKYGVGNFKNVVTSRSESKSTDNKLKDLMYTGPYCIQCKAEETPIEYTTMLDKMKRNFPGELPLIFHKRNHLPEVVIYKSDYMAGLPLSDNFLHAEMNAIELGQVNKAHEVLKYLTDGKVLFRSDLIFMKKSTFYKIAEFYQEKSKWN